MISRQDMYGFEVIETISKEIEVNENTIYPILRRLTKAEYLPLHNQSFKPNLVKYFPKIRQFT